MTNYPRLIVLTPVKNEGWILERFLSVTSQFADHIIILDQNSSDDSLNICRNYSKVTVIDNPSESFNEDERQLLLIAKAREITPDARILLALDADEILAADAINQPGWKEMLKAKPGTVLRFEKPDLYGSTKTCIRYKTPWPIGYVDDGAEHQPKKIHSTRIPSPENADVLHVKDVKVLHYSFTCMDRQKAKDRLYSVLENRLGTITFAPRRRMTYRTSRDYTAGGILESSRREWFENWEELGIDMHSSGKDKYYWQDFRILEEFYHSGERRFWPDDIWDFDWEECRQYAKALNMENIQNRPISTPPLILRWLFRFEDRVFLFALSLKRSLFSFLSRCFSKAHLTC